LNIVSDCEILFYIIDQIWYLMVSAICEPCRIGVFIYGWISKLYSIPNTAQRTVLYPPSKFSVPNYRSTKGWTTSWAWWSCDAIL